MAKSDDFINAANALVAVLGTATADGVIPGAGTALSGGASFNYLRQRLLGATPDLNARIARELQTAITQPKVHMPKDADKLLPQMIERGIPKPDQIMAARRNPAALCDAMLARMSDPEHRRVEIQATFRAVVVPILSGVLSDPETNDRLRPAFETAVAETLGHIAEQVEVMAGKLDQMQKSSEELGLTKGLVIGLARRIANDVSDMDGAMRELERAVETWKDLRDRAALPSNTGDQIDAVLNRIAELNAEDKFDEAADEVDRALVEIEAEAETLQARKSRMLEIGLEQDILRRNPESAARRIVAQVDLSDTADGFAALGDAYVEWYERGRDKGLAFDLEVAIGLAAANFDKASSDHERGFALNDKAIAMHNLASHSCDLVFLKQVVQTKRNVLDYWTRGNFPVDWALGTQNLAVTLQALGERESGTAGLEEAVAAYRAALTVRTRDRVPLDWAMTQNNLGDALRTLGACESGTARLEEAVTAFRAALEVYQQDRVPLEWATTQNNLGIALRILGERESGTARLEEAVAAFCAALEVLTRERVPLNWAFTQGNLGDVELAFFDKTGDGAHLDAAEGYVQAAREVFAEAGASHYLGLADAQLAQIAERRAAQ